MKTIYYDTITDEDAGCINLAVTAKTYWDTHHLLDEGFNDNYEKLTEALKSVGCNPVADSQFGIYPPLTMDTVIDKMRELGYDLITNKNFSNFLKNPC